MTEMQESLRRLIPLNTLSASRFDQVCAAIKVEDAPKGTVLFHQGDATNEFVYLLAGTISLQAGGVEMDAVASGTDVARFALAHQNPRKVSAIAKDQIRFVRIVTDLVYPREEPRPPLPEAKDYEVLETSENDWMSSLLRSPIFQKLPPANLQAVLRAIQEIKVKAGEVIFRQDDEGDYFYIIKHGQCSLTRKPSPTAKEIRLATLKSRDSFGEDALISEQPRTLTVTMDVDGELLRLDKASFLKLVSDPVIAKMTAREAMEAVNQGAIWLDVRMPDQYQNGQPRGEVIKAPFFSLRMMLPTLDRSKKYIAVCETGKISEAAAYLLLRFRFNARVLKGGMSSLPPEEIVEGVLESVAETALEPIGSSVVSEVSVRADFSASGERLEPAAAPAPIQPPAERSRPSSSASEPEAKPLESRLARLIADKEKSDAELQQARLAVHRLQTALMEIKRERDQLLQHGASVIAAPRPRETDSEHSLRQEVEELKNRYAQAVFEKDFAAQEVQNLERQVVDLKAMVEDFMEQEPYSTDAQVEALRAELEMVREQAGSELTTLQTRLSEVEAEKARLDTDLQLVQVQLSAREAVEEPDENSPQQSSKAPAFLIGLLLGILIAALLAAGLFGLPAGRDMVKAWLGDAAPGAVSPPQNNAPG